MECVICHSHRVVKGAVSYGRELGHFFSPNKIKFAARTFKRGTDLENFACLDCGFVWSCTNGSELESFVRKHTKQKIDHGPA